jgi:hypothetical protein
VGGYVSEGDAEKMKPLLNGLSAAGYTSGKRLINIDDHKQLNVTNAKLKDYIREATLVDPDRRSIPSEKIDAFQRFLNDKGIDFTIASKSYPET